MSEKEKIEFEEITVKVPKLIIDFLRKHEKILGKTAQEYMERNIVDCVRADIDAGDVFVPVPEEVVEQHGLGPVFKAVLKRHC